MNGNPSAAASLSHVSHAYGKRQALRSVSLEFPFAKISGLMGPDGVGKSTILGLVAGARHLQSGEVTVLGGDIADPAFRAIACPRIAYMPQGLGKNLYPDLSVLENVEFFARLFGQRPAESDWRIERLLRDTGLAPFGHRPARKLSGGMRQKLGLCCALVHDPDLLLLDEPTTGIDPLSRRQFWDLIAEMRERHPGLSIVVATAYMEEAERFEQLFALDDGRLLAAGTPDQLKSKTGAGNLEEVFIALLPEDRRQGHRKLTIPPRLKGLREVAIAADGLTRRFGDFLAVDHVSFTIERGEIFGFLGANGSGKSTTMKMLTGLLPPTSGSATLLGQRLNEQKADLRQRVGYMSQSFSLYTELTVRQNLDLHARLFHLAAAKVQARIAALVGQFGLSPYLDRKAAELPLGVQQRLSLAVAVIHEPELLILDEPTSGVDPLARDDFWGLLIDLSRNQGVTIFVSTHFMNEASRCDRIVLMESGRVLASGAPSDLIAEQHAANLEEAFIRYLAAQAPEPGRQTLLVPSGREGSAITQVRSRTAFSLYRLRAYAIREALELWRDPIRLGFAVFGTAFLMLVLGFGISVDVDEVPFAVLDLDRSTQGQEYLEQFRGSRYFSESTPVTDYRDLDRRLKGGEVNLVVEIPPSFGRNVESGKPAEVGAWIDGAMPFRAETIHGYLLAAHRQYLNQLLRGSVGASLPPSVNIETRFRYNQDFASVAAMVPGTIALLLVLIPAILMALSIVREKELGSIINLYVTPVTRLEFLIGKQLPYIVLAMLNFMLLALLAVTVFSVPLKGSLATLILATLVYVAATTGFGMLISAFTRTQIAALFGTAILTILPATQFSGMLTPVSSLSGLASAIGHAFPMTYYLRISVGTFTKALGFADLETSILALLLFVPALLALALLFLRKQAR